MVQALRTNKLFLEEKIQNKLLSFIKRKVKLQNVVTYYQLAKSFNLGILAKDTLSYIVRCFTMVTKFNNFLQLDFVFVAKIISSSELEITSELEVMNAADEWVRYNYAERSKFAEDLLLKVRLHLLSDHVLKHLSLESYNTRSSSVFKKNYQCILLIKNSLQNKDLVYQNKSFRYYMTRYCNQNKFHILICGGMNTTTNNVDFNVVQVDGEKLDSIKLLTQLPKCEYIQVLNVNDTFYSFIESNDKQETNVQVYCSTTDSWKKVIKISRDLEEFSLCTFMNNIFVIGGRNVNNGATHSSFELNTVNYKKKYIKRINEARNYAASTAFEGKIVVSGGYINANDRSNTVEAYDHVANTWSYMPNMIYGRYNHRLVAVRNKLYVFGGRTEQFEVFDSLTNKCSLLKTPSSLQNRDTFRIGGAISIGNKILIFRENSPKFTYFDIDKADWFEETFVVTKDVESFLCLKMAKI